MKDDAETTNPSAATLHAALLEYYSAPGKYQLSLRQPATLFGSIREILQIAAGRGSGADASGGTLQEAATFFIRAALLYPGADHYAVMGFPFGTEPTDLKERYRLLMRLIHPDFAQAGAAAWPSDAAVRVNRANEVLSSSLLRREYEDQLASLKQQRPAGAAKAASHAPVPAARRQHEPRLQVGKRAAWALGIALTALGILMLMPRQEPDHLVQRKTQAPPAVASEPVRVQEPLALPASPARLPEPPVLPVLAERPAAPHVAPHVERRPAPPAAPVAPVAAVAPAAAAPARPPVAAAPARPAPAMARPAAQEAPATVPPPLPLPPPVVAAAAVAPVASTPAPAVAPVASTVQIARATTTVAVPAIAPPTLSDAQPLLTQVLQMLETGSGEQLLRLLEADARQAPGAQALSRNFEQLVKGARPVHLTQVEFKGEPRDGVLLVTGRIRLHAGETTIGSHGQRLLLRAEFASRGGKVMLTNLSGAPD